MSIMRRYIREALTPMMGSEHITGAFGKLADRILGMRSFDMSYSEIITELVKDPALEHEDIRNAVAAARMKEEMGEEWYSPKWAK